MRLPCSPLREYPPPVPPEWITTVLVFSGTIDSLPRYNSPMALAIHCMHLLEVMFFVGLAGSVVVVAISFVEDGAELFSKE